MFMEKKRIQILLQKYYDGISSREDELDLIEYFSNNEVPEEWSLAKEQLLGIEDMSNEAIPIPENLHQNILKNLEYVQNESKSRKLNTKPIYSAISVAASVLLIITALMFLNRQPNPGSIEDSEVAFAETKQALDLVSKYFNEGTEKLYNLSKIDEAIKPLDNLQRVDETLKTMECLKNFDKGVETVKGILNLNKQ